MGINLLSKLVATGLVLALSSVSAAQTVGAVSEGGLRPSWSDSGMTDDGGRSATTCATSGTCQPGVSRSGYRGSAAPAKWSVLEITTSSQACQRGAARCSVCQCLPGRPHTA